MYLRHYGLRELPFELTPNPRFLFMTPQHREALANLQYGLSSAKAVTLLIGEAGTGKTTLLRTALDSEEGRRIKAVHLTNPGAVSKRVHRDAGAVVWSSGRRRRPRRRRSWPSWKPC